MKIKNILALASLTLPMTLAAQTINFETQDYARLGVYDTWEASPFRTGALKGNYAVVDNHLNQVEDVLGVAPNPSNKILAVQRSRFGSNTFGVRIDLKETFELTPQTKYLHVMMNRPYSGRVMVIGLGKRQDRSGQSPETEQFWAMSTSPVPANRWQDVVVSFKGNGGIDIYSLVIVPDLESPHDYTEDQVCYIDNIEVSDDSTPKFTYDFYPLNIGKEQLYTRTDRRVTSVSLTSPADGAQTVSTSSSPNYVYQNMTSKVFTARPGETVTPNIGFNGSWMHGYVFLDRNNDGKFQATINSDYTRPADSELMSYSYYGTDDAGKNSSGANISGNGRNVLPPPAFQIPADMPNGIYRLRYKVDWNSIESGGRMSSDNSILANGGGIVDVLLNVHGDKCNVNDANRNGEVLAADGKKLVSYQAPFGKPFTIRMNPEKGFEYAGIIVKHGYNLAGDSVMYDNVQWRAVRFDRQLFNEAHEFTIPAELMDGDIEIEGLFIEEGTYVPPVEPTRYTTTTVTNGEFADTTSWYTMQIGQDGYVLANNGSASYIALNNTEVNQSNPAHLWCFTGNEKDGYHIYNKEAGALKVLAAPTQMLGTTGSASHPTLQLANALPAGYTATWRFANSSDLGSNSVAYAYMYEDGYPANKVNNRDNKLAFWNGGQDAGSTLRILFAYKDIPTGVQNVTISGNGDATYDLSGRKVNTTHKGVYIQDGEKKYIKK